MVNMNLDEIAARVRAYPGMTRKAPLKGIVDKLKSETENLAWLGLIPDQSVKGDLFAQGDRVDGEQLIQAKGFHAGLNGLDRVSGYGGGSSEDRLWLESFDAGRKEYDTELPDIMARITAAATKEEPAPSGDADPFDDAA
jgi:hypothetical protein